MSSAFEYQLELLKVELDQINSSIRQMDEITKSIKDWAIVTWTFSLGASLSNGSLTPFNWTNGNYSSRLLACRRSIWTDSIQSRFIYRNKQISDFLNDARLNQSFDEQRLIDFQIMDPMAFKSRGHPDYESNVSISKTLRLEAFIFILVLY